SPWLLLSIDTTAQLTSTASTISKDESLDLGSSLVDSCCAGCGFIGNFEFAKRTAQKRSRTGGRGGNCRAGNVILFVSSDASTSRISRHSELHVVHLRRSCAALRVGSGSARSRYATHDCARRALHLRLQHWLHGWRQEFRPLFRVSLVFFGRNAGARYFE